MTVDKLRAEIDRLREERDAYEHGLAKAKGDIAAAEWAIKQLRAEAAEAWIAVEQAEAARDHYRLALAASEARARRTPEGVDSAQHKRFMCSGWRRLATLMRSLYHDEVEFLDIEMRATQAEEARARYLADALAASQGRALPTRGEP